MLQLDIFSTPVYIDEIKNFNLSENFLNKFKERQQDIKKQKQIKPLIKHIKNLSNKIFNDSYLIECKNYKIDVVSMWINKHKSNQNHPPHMHRASLLSGIYFPCKNNNYPDLNFLRPYAVPFLPITKKLNNINSNTCNLPYVKNRIYMFPSYIYHFVNVNNSLNTRITIAFDVLLRGVYGEQQETLDVGKYNI